MSQCIGKTKTGKQCKRAARTGEHFCRTHGTNTSMSNADASEPKKYNSNHLVSVMNVPLGRSISDFSDISIAERKLIECTAKGIDCVIGSGELPNCKTKINAIRSSLLRFLLLSGDALTPVHEKGIDISGAWIDGLLDLDGCKKLCGLVLSNCILKDYVRAIDAEIQMLAFMGVVINGSDSSGISFYGDRLTVEGDLHLSNSRTFGGVHLGGANIGGVLNFKSTKVSESKVGPDGAAVFADGIQVHGDVFFSDGFKACGEVRLLGGEITDSLICSKGNFQATIEPNTKRKLFNSDALSLSHCKIGRTLILDLSSSNDSRAAVIKGGLNLQGARVENLMDSFETIPKEFSYQRKKYNGFLVLDGFVYNNLLDASPTDASFRIMWLEKQVDKHLKDNFRSQPFIQLAQVLRKMGHERDALEVLIAKEEMRANSGTMPFARLIWHKIMGVLISYGYKPWKVLYFGLLFWFIGAVVFGVAWRAGDIVPAHPFIAMKPEFRACHEITHPTDKVVPLLTRIKKHDDVLKCMSGRSKTNAKVVGDLSDYPQFNEIVYPLDVILPIVELRQEGYWIPSSETYYGAFARVVLWLLTAIGWFLTAIGAAAVTGLVRKK